MKRMGAVESDSVKSARKAKDKLHKACERASETREQTMHGQEQNRIRIASIVGCNPTFCFSPDLPFFVKVGLHPTMASTRKSRDSDRFLVKTQVQSHALLRRGFGTSVPHLER